MKIHFGCGTNKFDGWINLDIIPGSDVVADITARWPFEDASADFIYSEHVLEHFDIATARGIFSEIFRVLKPGGVVRIAMPDLDNLIREYQSPKWLEQEWIQKFGYANHFATSCEMMNTAMRDWGHLFIYNKEQIELELNRFGAKIVHQHFGKSKHPELKNLETRADSKLIVEATK
jgi:predicted SAM-dependent methyltransferase